MIKGYNQVLKDLSKALDGLIAQQKGTKDALVGFMKIDNFLKNLKEYEKNRNKKGF